VRKLRHVNPRNPLNHLVESDVARRVTFGRKAIFMPLGLAVAAAVVPHQPGLPLLLSPWEEADTRFPRGAPVGSRRRGAIKHGALLDFA
jgi:hypothetical protein